MADMIDLQSHSTVSDGQLPPADVVRSAAEAGVTVMALTDHDGVAGVEEANRIAAELGIENVPAVEMSCVHKYSEDLHICGYWVDLEKIQPACDRAQQERVDRAKQIIAKLNEHGVDVSFEDAVAQGRRRRRDRPPAHRQGGRRRARPRPVLRGVPRSRRQGVRLAQLAERRAGRRPDPRGRRRRRRRPSLLGRQGSRPGPRPRREPRPRRRPRRHRDLLPASHRGADEALPRALRGVRTRPDGVLGLPRPDPQDVQQVGRLRHLRARRAAGAGEAVRTGAGSGPE